MLAAFFGELAEADGGGQSGRAATDEEDVDFELIAFGHNYV